MTKREPEQCLVDIEIEYMNQKRGIPTELSAEETQLYTYSQSITLKLLQDIRDKFEQTEARSDPSDQSEKMDDFEREGGGHDFPILMRA